MIRGIHHVTVHVRDLERMRRFYIEAFGFQDMEFAGGWENSPEIDYIVDVPGSLTSWTRSTGGPTSIRASATRCRSPGARSGASRERCRGSGTSTWRAGSQRW